MDLEQVWYELSPYVYGIGGVYAFFQDPPSSLLRISGVLLVAAALTILRMRWRYRTALYRQVPDAMTMARAASESELRN